MSTITAKEVVVTWDGDPATWPDYSRKVRLQWEKTQPHKRRHLGPDLASRLTGRAWGVTADLNHRLLAKKNGTKYLLRVLRDRLCRTAVPDAGARLEDLLIRLRRPLGMTMSQWSNEVMETYRKVQRALMRAQQQQRERSPKKDKKKTESMSAQSEPQAEPPSPTRSPTGRSPTTRAAAEPHAEADGSQGEGYVPIPQTQADRDEEHREWTDEEWKQWYKEKRKVWEEDSSSSGEDLPWDELEVAELQVLPDEILGWLLLRRANLSASSRLSVQASVQNSLSFRDIEMALRDQEEELLQADQQRHPHGKKRTFWVEEQGQWGLVSFPEENLDEATDILWVGDRLPPEVYGHDPSDGALQGSGDNEEIYWHYDHDGWHGYVPDGQGYWMETDGCGTYWSAEDALWEELSPEEHKELDEAFAAYETKARTFLQSRQLQRAKGKSRGFYPVGMLKGKSKGKGKGKKGKGFGATSSSSSTSMSASTPTFAVQGDVMAANGNVGCFICGDRGHGFRNCPKRNNNGSPGGHHNKGTKKGTFWVEAVTPSPLAFVGMVAQASKQIMDTTGYGVLDLGATETVGSLEALESLMALRHQQAGEDEQIQVFTGPSVNKPFRFGNGGIKFSESYVLIPQRLGEARVMLGLYTIDANKVPILIGMKTLEKLGAIIDVQGQCMVLANVAPDFKIPLGKSHAGHLLVDLTSDCLSVGQPLKTQLAGVYKAQAAEVGQSVELNEKVVTAGMTTSTALMAEAVDDPAVDQHEASGEEGETEENPTVFMLDPHDHSRQPLVQVDQTMRDGIIQSLITASPNSAASSLSHGAQESFSEEGGAAGRAVRLRTDGTDEPQRSQVVGPSVPRRARSCSSRTGLSDGLKPTCDVGGMPPLRHTDEVCAGVWRPCHVTQSRTPGERRCQADGGEEARGRQHGAAEPEDQPGRGREIPQGPPDHYPEAEGRWGQHAEEEGQLRPAHQRPRWRIPERPCGPRQDPINFDAFSGWWQRRGLHDEPDTRTKVHSQGGDDIGRGGAHDQAGVHGEEGGGRRVAEGEQGLKEKTPEVNLESEMQFQEVSQQGTSSKKSPMESIASFGSMSLRSSTSLPRSTSASTSKPLPSSTSHSTSRPLESSMSSSASRPLESSMSSSPTRPLESSLSSSPLTPLRRPTVGGVDFELYEPVEEDTNKPARSFTPEGILPAGSASKRRKTASQSGETSPTTEEKMTPEETAFLVSEMEQYVMECEELFHGLHVPHYEGRLPTVMELCCEEDSGVTKAMESLGGRGLRCGLFNGCDLSKKSGFNKVMHLLQTEKPDVLLVSLPCGPTSNIQELNKLTEEGRIKNEKKVERSKRLASRAVTLMQQQVRQRGEVIQEWPRHNKAWHFRSIRGFWGSLDFHEAQVDGCAYGLTAPKGGLIKKPWRWRSTTKKIWQLQRLCQCQQPHVPCEGGELTRLSALYPPRLCSQVARLVKLIHLENEAQIFTVQNSPDYDTEVLKKHTDQELMKVAADLMSLHKKLGHPSKQVFVKMLRDRGASTMVRTIAANLHCMDCQEASIPPSRRAVTLEGATQLWDCLQLDNMEITVGEETFHFQVIIDEASSYGAANFLFKHPVAKSRNPTTEEVLQALYRGWIQHFGYPKCIKLDKEGAHRGRSLEEWAEGHGVEVQAIPAEAHTQISQVERLIGDLKSKLMAHLRSSGDPPEVATWAMVAAHNSMTNVGGYSPMQWVFGRNMTEGDRLHDGPDLPFWSGLNSDEKMQRQLQARLDAEQRHREMTYQNKINQAFNTKMQHPVRFQPGDLVYYKRFQAPQDKAERSHQLLDLSRRRVARWFGPARVLAMETKTSYEGQVRQAHAVAWIIASGRLKRVMANQLRFASDREKVIAETTTPLATPWTFQDLTNLISKGEFDDELITAKQQAQAERRLSMGRLVVEQERAPKRPLQPQLVDDVEATGHSHKEARGSEAPVPDDVDLDDLRHQEQPELDGERLVADPG